MKFKENKLAEGAVALIPPNNDILVLIQSPFSHPVVRTTATT